MKNVKAAVLGMAVMMAGAAVAGAQSATPVTKSEARDIRRDHREVVADSRDVKRDTVALRAERREVRQDLNAGKKGKAKRDEREARADRRDLRRDTLDLAKDKRDVRKDRRALRDSLDR